MTTHTTVTVTGTASGHYARAHHAGQAAGRWGEATMEVSLGCAAKVGYRVRGGKKK